MVHILLCFCFFTCVNLPQQQNAMGSLRNIDFGVFWASWGRSGNRVPGTGFREPVPIRFQVLMERRWFEVSMGSDRFWVPKVVPGFDVFLQVPVQKMSAVSKVLEFRVLMGSDGFEGFGFRWGPEGSGIKSCRRHVGPSSCHLGVSTMRLAMLYGERMHSFKKELLNLLAVGDATYAYFS